MSQRIVVGVDGSTNSRKALQYALDEARRRDALVQVVHAYPLPTPAVAGLYGAPLLPPSREELEREALKLIDQTIGVAPKDLQIDRIACPGTAEAQLLRVAQGADLLVVGSRGRGGFIGSLLGSTSQTLVRHAPCPELVVPTRRSDLEIEPRPAA